MNFGLNYVSIFFVILLIFIQLFIVFVYEENLKIKYQKFVFSYSHKNKPLDLLKNNLEKNQFFNFQFKVKENFFQKNFDLENQIIKINKNFLNNSIYAYVNIMYLNFDFLSSNNRKNKNELIIKILQFIFFNSGLILLAINLWIIALVLFGVYFLIIIIDILTNYKRYKKNYLELNQWFEKNALDEEKQLIKKYLKYKKINFLYKHLVITVLPIKNLFINFKKWGH